MPFSRILIIRTDRLGDVLMNLPLINCLKRNYPNAGITVVAKRELAELLSLDGDIDSIIPFDINKEGKTLRSKIAFAHILKRHGFGLAVISNPTKLFHMITYFAGIPRRVGYNRKWAFLLTDAIEDKKFEGRKHEIEYNLELIRRLGIEPGKIEFSMLPDEKEDEAVDRILSGCGIARFDNFVLIHPHSSNPAKCWPKENYTLLSDRLNSEAGCIVGIIGGKEEAAFSNGLMGMMKRKAINLCGRFSLKQLPNLFKRARLLISNDSGPNHIAAAVATPVLALFGGDDPGTGPGRWGPYGEGHIVLHKPDLSNITVDEVFGAAKEKIICKI